MISFDLLVKCILILCIFFPSQIKADTENGCVALFPALSSIEPCKYSGKPEIYTEHTLYEYIDGAADLYLEFGFRQLVIRELNYNEDFIIIELYEMSDPTAAWGIYSSQKYTSVQNVKGFQFGYSTPYSFVFCKSRFYVCLKTNDTSKELAAMLLHIAEMLESNIPQESLNIADLFQCFPKSARIPDSYNIAYGTMALNKIHYFNSKNIFQLNRQTPARVARYQLDEKIFPVFIVCYQNRDITQNVLKNLKEHLADAPQIEKLTIFSIKNDDDIFYVMDGEKYICITLTDKLTDRAIKILTELEKSECCKGFNPG